MSKSKSPSINLPDAPSFQSDPNVGWSQDQLKAAFNYLNQGLTTSGGSLSGMLGDTVNLSPEISKLATQQYVSAQEPAYRRGLQDITNTLEANNQLTGSTTGNVLQNYQNDYLAGLTSANAGIAIQDINRALSNRVSLYGTALNTAQGVGQTGLNNQNQMNQFALANYENQVAQALMNNQNQSGGTDWWGIGGSAVGATIGTLIAPGVGTSIGAGLGGQLGSSIGGGNSGGNSGQYLQMGASLLGNKFAGANPNIISSGGAGARSESIMNSLYQTPSWYGQGLGSGASYGF